MRERIDVRKVAAYSIIINSVQIIAVLTMLVVLLIEGPGATNRTVLTVVMVVASVLVCWGAVVDIREARSSVRMQEQAEALAKTYEQLEALHQTMRAQRHDFMNHLQVVYSLIELQEEKEALDYIERVHGDMQRVSRALRTKSPAINALLQAKLADCEKRGIQVRLTITSMWEHLSVPGWEMCRVFGNLLDNSMDALQTCKNPCLTIVLYEDVKSCRFQVENNGQMIPPGELQRIFQAGFTTKGQGQGMGLHIVRSIMRQYHGDVTVASDEKRTVFEGFVPKKETMVVESEE